MATLLRQSRRQLGFNHMRHATARRAWRNRCRVGGADDFAWPMKPRPAGDGDIASDGAAKMTNHRSRDAAAGDRMIAAAEMRAGAKCPVSGNIYGVEICQINDRSSKWAEAGIAQ